MGKRITLASLVACMFVSLTPTVSYADTVKDIFKVYGISQTTELEKTESELNKKSTDYKNLVKAYAFADFYNTAISLTSSNDVMSELNEAQGDLRNIEYELLSSFDAPLSTIKSYDNAYVHKMEYTNFLLRALDSYRGITSMDMPDGDLYAMESELAAIQDKYGQLTASSNIGNVKNLIHPVQAVMNISSKYGTRVSAKDTSKTEKHDGIDFSADEGTGVLALFSGTVIYADYDEEKGETVRISHGEGVVTEYRHLKERYVLKGTTVKQYQKIGTVGTTGKDVGKPHLHLSLYINGKSYDPSKLLVKEGTK